MHLKHDVTIDKVDSNRPGAEVNPPACDNSTVVKPRPAKESSMSSRPTVAVVGASADRSKFGNKAVRAYRLAGFEVYPINPKEAEIEGLPAHASLDELPVEELDRVSFYVPAPVGLAVLDQVARKRVGQVWLNPGADAPEVVAKARGLGLEVVQACGIVALGQDPGRL